MNKIELLCTVDNSGKIVSGRQRLIKALQSFAGKRITLTIERQFKKRSGQQNRSFHGYMLDMIQERLLDLGWEEAMSKEWVKGYVKEKCFVGTITNKITGEMMECILPTSSLSTTQWNDRIAMVQQWAAEHLDLYIPDPNEQTEIKV